MSTLKADTIQSTSGGAATLTKQSAAKQWVKFNPSATIADSLNTSSVTDNATGRFTVARTNSMSNANYATQVNGDWTVGTDTGLGIYTADNGVITASDTKLVFYTSGGGAFYDVDGMAASINGDLA